MAITLVTPPTPAEILELLPVATMKAHLRVSHSVEDALIEDSILEAYDWLAGEKGWLNRAVLTSTWKLVASAFPTGAIILRRPPVASITSVRYLVGGSYQTMGSSLYSLSNHGGHAKVSAINGGSWPVGVDTNENAVEVTYVAGYGDADLVIEKHPALVRALKILAADYYRHREETMVDIRMVEIDRKIVNNVERVAGRYKLLNWSI